jgi:nicotinate-nucleotide adenylyltransferase
MKIGLYFGSFNPPHVGHLTVAHYAREVIGLDEVWFIVSPNNPHKDPAVLMDVVHRVNMTALALYDYPYFKVDTTELELPTPSYTYQTLLKLRSAHPAYEWHLIIGEDNLPRFHEWREVEFLKKHLTIWVYPRLGVEVGHIDPSLMFTYFDAPRVEFSSTEVRKRLRNNQPIRFMVGADVETYLLEKLDWKQS